MSGQLGQFDLLPQRIYANPAFQPMAKFNIAIPALGNTYVEHGNNWINPVNFVESGTNVLSPEAILAAIDDEATTGFSTGIELFHAGFRFGKHYVHIRAGERFQSRINLPVDIFNLAVYGNVGDYQFENNTANFSGLAVDAIHFREYAAGFNTQITDKINVGVTGKYLYGMEVIQTEQSSLQLRTDPDTYELTSSGSFAVNTSGIYGFTNGTYDSLTVADYLLNKTNSGFAFDAGATYRPIERLELQFSAHDIGFISWKDDLSNYQTDDASFVYDGVDLTEFLFEEGADFSEEFENEMDSLLNELEEVYGFERTEESLRTNLNGFLRFGTSFNVFETKKHAGNAWFNVVYGLGESLVPLQASLGYNQKLWNSIQASLHVSKRDDLPFALGGGLALNAGAFQVYALVENLSLAPLAEVTITDSDNPSDQTTVILPANQMDLRLHFGVNLTFNRNFGAKDKDTRAMLR